MRSQRWGWPGATLNGTFSLDPPSGIPAPQSGLRSAASRAFAPRATASSTSTTHTGVAYIAFTTSTAVTVSGSFDVTFAGTSAVASSAFVAYYDGTAWQYDVPSNPSTATGNALDFKAQTSGPLTFASGKSSGTAPQARRPSPTA